MDQALNSNSSAHLIVKHIPSISNTSDPLVVNHLPPTIAQVPDAFVFIPQVQLDIQPEEQQIPDINNNELQALNMQEKPQPQQQPLQINIQEMEDTHNDDSVEMTDTKVNTNHYKSV